jgi:hypothetical protein
VIVAVIAMRVVQAALDNVIGVIAMRHGGMTAPWTVNMPGFVALVPALWSATARVSVADFDNVFVDAVPAHTVQMTIMQIVDVIAMFDGDVSAPRAMTMRMFSKSEMRVACHDRFLSWR